MKWFWPLRGMGLASSIACVIRIEAPRRLPTVAEVNLAGLSVLAFVLVTHLWGDWTHDPDLSHAFLMPVIAVALLHMSRPPRFEDTLQEKNSVALCLLFGASALLCLGVAGLFAATLDWSSPVVDFALATSFGLLACGAIAAFASRTDPWVPFNWTSLCAAVLWPLCSPLPPGSYARLTLGLQLWVSTNVMRALDLLGIAAHRDGNIIQLAHGSVGIEEACSGVRSLISCVFAALLFSAALCRRPMARVLVIALSVPLALAMNFLRSLLLTLLVNAGVHVEGAWHDATGYGVLVATAALLFGAACFLDRSAAKQESPKVSPIGHGGIQGVSMAQHALQGLLALGFAALLFFSLKTASSPEAGSLVPDLAGILPSSAPGWQVETTQDLYKFAGTLRTDHLAQRTYTQRDALGTKQVTLYLAYWLPGQASVGLVGSHTPDACWPGTGWIQIPAADPSPRLALAGATLPAAQHRSFAEGGYPQQVWYWQLYGGKIVNVENPRSVPALIRIALKYGFRKGGEQAFVRVSSNRPWEEVSHEPFLADFFNRARSLGLY